MKGVPQKSSGTLASTPARPLVRRYASRISTGGHPQISNHSNARAERERSRRERQSALDSESLFLFAQEFGPALTLKWLWPGQVQKAFPQKQRGGRVHACVCFVARGKSKLPRDMGMRSFWPSCVILVPQPRRLPSMLFHVHFLEGIVPVQPPA